MKYPFAKKVLDFKKRKYTKPARKKTEIALIPIWRKAPRFIDSLV